MQYIASQCICVNIIQQTKLLFLLEVLLCFCMVSFTFEYTFKNYVYMNEWKRNIFDVYLGCYDLAYEDSVMP